MAEGGRVFFFLPYPIPLLFYWSSSFFCCVREKEKKKKNKRNLVVPPQLPFTLCVRVVSVISSILERDVSNARPIVPLSKRFCFLKKVVKSFQFFLCV